MDIIEFDGVDIETMTAEELRLIIREFVPDVETLQLQADASTSQLQAEFDRLGVQLASTSNRADRLKKLKSRK